MQASNVGRFGNTHYYLGEIRHWGSRRAMENVAVKDKRKPRPSLRNIEAKFSELKTWQRVRIKSNIKIDQWAVREDFQKWMDEHANCAWEVVRGCKTAGSPADFPCYVYLKRPNKKLVLLLALTWSS